MRKTIKAWRNAEASCENSTQEAASLNASVVGLIVVVVPQVTVAVVSLHEWLTWT